MDIQLFNAQGQAGSVAASDAVFGREYKEA